MTRFAKLFCFSYPSFDKWEEELFSFTTPKLTVRMSVHGRGDSGCRRRCELEAWGLILDLIRSEG